MSVQRQQALDFLYALDNVLTIKITMPQADWDAVRTEQPAGGVCNFEWTGGSRVHVAQGSVGRDMLAMAGLPNSWCNAIRFTFPTPASNPPMAFPDIGAQMTAVGHGNGNFVPSRTEMKRCSMRICSRDR